MPTILKRIHRAGRAPVRLMRGGSILLRKGAGGAASSYSSENQYHDITGNGLYAQSGRGLSEKLSKLSARPTIGGKIRNIRF